MTMCHVITANSIHPKGRKREREREREEVCGLGGRVCGGGGVWFKNFHFVLLDCPSLVDVYYT